MRQEIGCPTCSGRLRVPVVSVGEIPVTVVETPAVVTTAASSVATAAPAAPAGFDFLAEETPAAASAVPTDPADAADLAATDDSSERSSSRSKSGRRRRSKKTPWGLYAFGVLLLAVVGGLGYVAMQTPDELVGVLPATVAASEMASGSVPYPASVSAEDRSRIVDAFGSDPVKISTASLLVEVAADDSGLTFTATPTETATVIDINADGDAALAAWLTANEAPLEAARIAGRDQAMAAVTTDLLTGEVDPNAVAGAFESVFLATLQGGLGSAVVANVGGVAVPVMRQDGRTLRLAVPAGTSLLTLVPKPSSTLPQPFEYRVVID